MNDLVNLIYVRCVKGRRVRTMFPRNVKASSVVCFWYQAELVCPQHRKPNSPSEAVCRERRLLCRVPSREGGFFLIESTCKVRPRFDPWVGKIPWRREWLPSPVLLPGESHGQGGLEGCSPRGRTESDTTEWLTDAHKQRMGSLCADTWTPCSLPGSGF